MYGIFAFLKRGKVGCGGGKAIFFLHLGLIDMSAVCLGTDTQISFLFCLDPLFLLPESAMLSTYTSCSVLMCSSPYELCLLALLTQDKKRGCGR